MSSTQTPHGGTEVTQSHNFQDTSLTESQIEFLKEYYFEAQPFSGSATETEVDFIVSKALNLRYLSTLFWTVMCKVEVPIASKSRITSIDLKQLHALEKSIREKKSEMKSYTFKEMTYEVLRASSLPLSAGEIVAEGRRSGILNTKGLSPDATLASDLNSGIKKHASLFPFAKLGPFFYLRHRESEMLTNILITPYYQRLGMRLWENRYKYIPREYEHRFLCYKTSTIGDGVGLGVFIKSGVQIPKGTILCEYTGSVSQISGGPHGAIVLPDEDILHPYSVNTGAGTDNESVIHGQDPKGIVQCYAALINDAGPVHANATYVEFEEAAGRVFVITKRRLMPSEEVFILYGCKYWDIDQYPPQSKFSKLKDWVGLLEHCPASHPPGEIVIERCLYCGKLNIPYRLMSLHRVHECLDIIQKNPDGDDPNLCQNEFNSLPFNEFTSSKHVKRSLSSTIMVDVRDPLTHEFTHDSYPEIPKTS